MEEKRTFEPSKVGTFLSSAANRVLNLIMILIIIALATLVAWFWHQNELLQNDIKNLNEKVEDFEKMNSMNESRDVVVGEEVGEVKKEISKENMNVDSEGAVSNSQIESETTDVVSSDLVIYKNDELGISFEYPKDLGNTDVSFWYGTENKHGRQFNLHFENLKYENSKSAETIQMALTSPNFGGFGTGRPIAISSGYSIDSEGKITIFRGEQKNDYCFNKKCTILKGDFKDGLLVEYYDELHGFNITRIIFNLNNREFKGCEFIAWDKKDSSIYSDKLKSIAQTFKDLN